MLISIHQPIFSPWLGFFYKMLHSDLIILLDDVQFPLGTTWTSRNRFKHHQGTLWLTIPVWKKKRGLQQINKLEICYEGKWQGKHLQSLTMAYAHAPYFRDHYPFWEKIYQQKDPKLLDLNLQVIEYLKSYLMISTQIKLSSSLGIEVSGHKRLVETCRKLNASEYLVQYEARRFINEDIFTENEIKVRYLKFDHPIYPQLWGEFIYNLSSWDLLFNCGPRSHEILNRGP